MKKIPEDRAVSPVIGVILMVAITVILSAVVATFVLGIGESLNDTAPQATFSFDYDSSSEDLTITHEGGESIEEQNLDIVNSGTTTNWGTTSNDVTAGDSIELSSVSSTSTVRVTYEDPSGGSSATLAKWEGPEA